MRLSHLRKSSHLSLLLCCSLLAACSDSGNNDNDSVTATAGSDLTDQGTTASTQDTTAGTTDTATAGSAENTTGSTTTNDNTNTEDTTAGATTDAATSEGQSNPETTEGGATTEGTSTPDSAETTAGTGETEQTPDTTTTDTDNNEPVELTPPTSSGNDVSGGEDDSPTATESASLVGPFIKDTNRPDGPPSVPQGLTLLMAGEDFVELSWIPSTDDQSVEGYEIYRDGALQYTIRGDTNFEFDYRSWITTSYIDCNYTRYTICDANPIVPGSSYEYRVAAIDNEGMKSELSDPVVFQLAQRQSGGADLTGYVQVLNEEFDADTLDRTYWKTSLPWGPDQIINSERQYFMNLFGSDPLPVNPFVMTGSTLQITGTVTPPELLESANNQPFISGVISTKDKFEMTYGYVEMRAKLAGGDGFLSTFYLFNQDFEKNKPEIDVIEYIGGRPNAAYQTYHYYDSNRARYSDGERHSTPTMESPVVNLSADFHTYSVLWEPGLIVWYIDGTEVRRLTGVRVSDEPMNIIAQLVVGSEWIGEPDPSALPKVLEIDYIKAWQKQ